MNFVNPFPERLVCPVTRRDVSGPMPGAPFFTVLAFASRQTASGMPVRSRIFTSAVAAAHQAFHEQLQDSDKEILLLSAASLAKRFTSESLEEMLVRFQLNATAVEQLQKLNENMLDLHQRENSE